MELVDGDTLEAVISRNVARVNLAGRAVFRDFGPIRACTTSSRCSGPSPPDMHSGLCIAT